LKRRLTLKVKILQAGESQKSFAEKVGLKDIRLSHLISGFRNPTKEERRKISKALNVSEEVLFIFDENESKQIAVCM